MAMKPRKIGEGLYQPLAEINVTPLVDVMLVLLIIFMVTAPMLAAGIKVNLPGARTAQPLESKDPVIVVVTKDGAVSVGKDTVSRDDLVAAVKARLANSNGVVQLRGDRDASYGDVVSVMDDLAAAASNHIAIVSSGRRAAPVPASRRAQAMTDAALGGRAFDAADVSAVLAAPGDRRRGRRAPRRRALDAALSRVEAGRAAEGHDRRRRRARAACRRDAPGAAEGAGSAAEPPPPPPPAAAAETSPPAPASARGRGASARRRAPPPLESPLEPPRRRRAPAEPAPPPVAETPPPEPAPPPPVEKPAPRSRRSSFSRRSRRRGVQPPKAVEAEARTPSLSRSGRKRRGADEARAGDESRGARRAERASGHGVGPSASAASQAAYISAMAAAIRSRLFYPPAARARGAKGVVGVAFTIGPSGALAVLRHHPFLGRRGSSTPRRGRWSSSAHFPPPPGGSAHVSTSFNYVPR